MGSRAALIITFSDEDKSSILHRKGEIRFSFSLFKFFRDLLKSRSRFLTAPKTPGGHPLQHAEGV